MNILSAEFERGIIGSDSILGDKRAQIAFVGRSNVGKSSVINSLVLRKDLVKSSATPGKTKEINFFLINGKYHFVDLPGYGFARMAVKNAEKLRKLILWYLTSGEAHPRLVVLVVDACVKPTQYDKEMTDLLRKEGTPFILVANKVDRLNQAERAHGLRAIEAALGVTPIAYSAKTKIGREVVLKEVERA